VFQGGVVAWVVFWSVYGQGLASANWEGIASFAAAYSVILLLEPLLNLGALALAKRASVSQQTTLFSPSLSSGH
jgi:hypothetical protein